MLQVRPSGQSYEYITSIEILATYYHPYQY